MMTSGDSSVPAEFTSQKAKVALQEILSALVDGEGVQALENAREVAGNDMVALMTQVFPLVTKITIDIICNYGFSKDGVGAIQFEHMVQRFGMADPDVARLHAQIRSYFLPAIVAPVDDKEE